MIPFIKKNHEDLFTLHEDTVPYISYKKLDQTGIVHHGITLRRHVDGTPVSMFHMEGEPLEATIRDCGRMMEQMGSDQAHYVRGKQTHSANVHVVQEEDLNTSLMGSHLMDVDALATNVPGTVLTISVADCIPLFFVDPVRKAIALAHSGRVGTMNHIGQNCVRTLAREYGSRPSDLIACIGPGICGECYEVGDEIYDEFFQNWGPDKTPLLFHKKAGRWYLDLWEANRIQLLEAGLKEENIEISNICNCCNKEHFYSYRGDHGKLNLIGACMALKQP